MSLTLTAEHIAAAREWLAKRPEHTRTEGEAMHARGAVADCEPYRRGVGFRARVWGDPGTFEAKVRYSDREWTATCSCSAGANCKHCVALTLYLISQEQPDTASSDIRVEEAPSFREELEKRLARSLTPDEERIAKAVDTIFQNGSGPEGFSAAMLEPIVGKAPETQRQNLKLWDESPHSAWQAWLYIAHFLERQRFAFLPSLRDATDWSEVDALVASRERRQSIQNWHEWLTRADHQQRGRQRRGP